MECVLLITGPGDLPGAEEAEIEILFEVIPARANKWIADKVATPTRPDDEVAYCGIDSPTGGWEIVHTPIVLPDPASHPSTFAEELRRYASTVVDFIKMETGTILDHLLDRALIKGTRD